MAIILLIDTATEVCSAAIASGAEVLAFREQKEGFRHSGLLTVFISQLLEETGKRSKDLDAVCVSRGPGSYTGLRIGVSVAKGICYAAKIPLISISSLQSMSAFVAGNIAQLTGITDFEGMLCPMLDARRMEIYSALYDRNCRQITPISARIIHNSSFAAELETDKMVFFGNGAMKCKEIICHPNAYFPEGIYASARFMSEMAEENFSKQLFENIAYFEPFYLKNFIATIPKNKVIQA
jgi:tRNA threonylcarbamoyladenosine biosynthesis protein TsaB